MKKRLFICGVIALILLGFAGCSLAEADPAKPAVSPDPELPGTPHAVDVSIVVRGFEWGPGVSKIIVELDEEVDAVRLDGAVSVTTSHYEREVTDAYLSDALGNASKTASRYAAFELATDFDCTGSPFEMDMETDLNIWAEEYIVTAAFSVMKNDVRFSVDFSGDCIGNRLCPELDRLTVQGTFAGEYENPLTRETEEISLNYAAYEPDSLASWEQNPLIIWLHGLGEGGEDITKVILGNEVSALMDPEIQSYFIAGEQTGAYVLLVQTPTYWLDVGDGTYHMGDMPSRYTEALMDTIEAYVAQNPDVDPDRIYLGGASNGGYMTLEMLINYPEYFAAGFPCCPAYSYYVYAKNPDGTYRTPYGSYRTLLGASPFKTGIVYFTDEKAEALMQTPLWITQAVTDTLVSAVDDAMPIYRRLILSGAENCWLSLYLGVEGTESSDTLYMSHWSWVYLLNDQLSMVQDPERVRLTAEEEREAILSDEPVFPGFMNWANIKNLLDCYEPNGLGGTVRPTGENGQYTSLFQWLNDQERDS